jgi:type I restriction enzyme S subunit
MWQEFWGRNVILSDDVELNPRVALPRDATVPFVSMDVISPGTRKVLPAQERQASGSGSKFLPGDTLFARITPCLENGKTDTTGDNCCNDELKGGHGQVRVTKGSKLSLEHKERQNSLN